MPGPRPSRLLAAASALARAGLRPERPDRLPRAMLALAAYGPTMAGGIAAATARYPLATALIDDAGPISYAQLWRATDGIGRELRARGVGPGSTVGILARNGRVFVLSLVAASKVGADIVYLNTGFAGPQLADVVAHEGVDTILHDDVFAEIVADAGATLAIGGSELRALGRDPSIVPLTPSRHVGRQVILTSGTTGRPKGAARGSVERRRLVDAAAGGGADPGSRHGRHRRPAVPRVGTRPPRRGSGDVVDGRRAGAVRSRGHAGRHRRAPRRRARRRPGHAAADPGPRR